MRPQALCSLLITASWLAAAAPRCELPQRYYELMVAGLREVERRASQEGDQAFAAIRTSHYHPGALLTAAVLYASPHASNPRRGDRALLSLAFRLGDLLAQENESGRYVERNDHHRDTYMWLEAYRLLEAELAAARGARWRRNLQQLIEDLAAVVAARRDRPRYTSPFGVPTNHTALQASTVHLAGRVFGNPEWERLGAYVMHRFAAQEQAPDGYWGEHSDAGPTTAYDYLTAAGVALYYEHSRDPAALEALRRSTEFHINYTWPDGQPVMLIDDRRRHAYISPWAHFGFSHFPEGRRYAAFLTSFYQERALSLEHLGRIAQDALYFHEGPQEEIPQDRPAYWHRQRVPAGIRKSGPWVVCLSGLISTQAVTSRYYLDRQAHLAVFHQKYGLIVPGANSKRQPELADLWERIGGQIFHLPLDSRLEMSPSGDRLALAYNSFFCELTIEPPTERRLSFYFRITRKGSSEAELTLPLRFVPGELVDDGTGRKFKVEEQAIMWDLPAGSIRHRGWKLSINSRAKLRWPVYPYNPYAEGPERELEYAVATLSVPLELKSSDAQPQLIRFTLEVE